MPSTPVKIDEMISSLVTFAVDCSRFSDGSCQPTEELKEQGRMAWGFVGDLIEWSSFFPITINVPDMFQGMYDMFNRVMDYFYGSENENESTPRIWDLLEELEGAMPDL